MDILVDLDGTLVDPKPGLIGSVQYALRKLGHPVPPAEELLWLIGPPFRVSFPKLLGRSDLTEEAIAHYRESYCNGAMYDAIVYDGVADALDRLRAAGCRLFVATAKPHYYARPILERFDLARRFAAIHGPELDGTNDHKHDLIAHIVAKEGVRPRGGPHDRRPRVRRDGRRPQRHPRPSASPGATAAARSWRPPAPPASATRRWIWPRLFVRLRSEGPMLNARRATPPGPRPARSTRSSRSCAR